MVIGGPDGVVHSSAALFDLSVVVVVSTPSLADRCCIADVSHVL